MLLNCIFEVLNTTMTNEQRIRQVLWIAFELYLWGIEHNAKACLWWDCNVVNCFWIVSLRYWTQQEWFICQATHCCELLLNCIFEVLNTTSFYFLERWFKLWIAFELYLWGIEHNTGWQATHLPAVVNCFWIVSLRYWTQHLCTFLHNVTRCELLLNCIFEVLNTTRTTGISNRKSCELLLNCIFEVLNTTWDLTGNVGLELWIAFELYLWGIEHNIYKICRALTAVVNCFWIVSLRYWTQQNAAYWSCSVSCELLLNCIFEVLNTTSHSRFALCPWLWIAFELYLWGIEHNAGIKYDDPDYVVNCFWIVSLRYWTQPGWKGFGWRMRCELLLNCIFEVLNTTYSFQVTACGQLWIAFELYLWGIEHNFHYDSNQVFVVVNCFWIVSLRYWTQRSELRQLGKRCCELLLNCIFEVLNTTAFI